MGTYTSLQQRERQVTPLQSGTPVPLVSFKKEEIRVPAWWGKRVVLESTRVGR